MTIVPLGPEAGRAVVAAVKQRHVIPLLCDRDINRTGVEVTFFGEKTTLPSGPAVLALRTGAPLLPTAVYDRGPSHHGVIRPAIPTERKTTAVWSLPGSAGDQMSPIELQSPPVIQTIAG